MLRRFPMMDKQSQIVQRYTTENHNIFRKQFEDTYRGFPMHLQRSTPLVDSQMCSTDFPNISFAQNQARARKIHPYAVGFAANTSSGRTVRTLRPLWRSICFSTAVVTCAPSCCACCVFRTWSLFHCIVRSLHPSLIHRAHPFSGVST